MPRSPLVLSLFEDAIARWRAYRVTAQTRHIVSNLSPQMLKDIGWPDNLPGRHRGASSRSRKP